MQPIIHRDPFLVHQVKSFKYAIEGFSFSFSKGTHLKMHVAAAVLVTILGIIYKVNETEWLILILISGSVISAETMNTAVEEACDVMHPAHHPGARLAKHCAAGAVLILSITAVIIGLIIFYPKMLG